MTENSVKEKRSIDETASANADVVAAEGVEAVTEEMKVCLPIVIDCDKIGSIETTLYNFI